MWQPQQQQQQQPADAASITISLYTVHIIYASAAAISVYNVPFTSICLVFCHDSSSLSHAVVASSVV